MALTLEQKQLRRTGITATDAAALVYSPFRTIYDIYLDKIGEIEAEEAPNDTYELAATVEQKLIEMMGQRYNLDVKPGRTVVHPTEKWILGTPDCFFIEEVDGSFETVAVGEAKNVGADKVHEWYGGGAPNYVKVQNIWQQIPACVKRGYIGAALGGTHPKFYENTDAKAAEAMQELGYNFWHKHVLPRNPPKPDGSESAARMVRALYPVDSGEVRDATPDEALQIVQYCKLAEELKRLEEQREAIGNQLRLSIGEYSALLIDGFTCSYRAPEGGSVSWKKIVETAKVDPKTIEKFTKPAARRLLVSRRAA